MAKENLSLFYVPTTKYKRLRMVFDIYAMLSSTCYAHSCRCPWPSGATKSSASMDGPCLSFQPNFNLLEILRHHLPTSVFYELELRRYGRQQCSVLDLSWLQGGWIWDYDVKKQSFLYQTPPKTKNISIIHFFRANNHYRPTGNASYLWPYQRVPLWEICSDRGAPYNFLSIGCVRTFLTTCCSLAYQRIRLRWCRFLRRYFRRAESIKGSKQSGFSFT
jgi:hypothetical protein